MRQVWTECCICWISESTERTLIWNCLGNQKGVEFVFISKKVGVMMSPFSWNHASPIWNHFSINCNPFYSLHLLFWSQFVYIPPQTCPCHMQQKLTEQINGLEQRNQTPCWSFWMTVIKQIWALNFQNSNSTLLVPPGKALKSLLHHKHQCTSLHPLCYTWKLQPCSYPPHSHIQAKTEIC